MQQPVCKSRKQICRGKSKLYTEGVPNSWRTPKFVQDKSKTRSSPKQNCAQSVGESLLIEKAKSLRQKQISYFAATYHVAKANSFVAKANHFRVAQKQQLVPRLPLCLSASNLLMGLGRRCCCDCCCYRCLLHSGGYGSSRCLTWHNGFSDWSVGLHRKTEVSPISAKYSAVFCTNFVWSDITFSPTRALTHRLLFPIPRGVSILKTSSGWTSVIVKALFGFVLP